VDVVPWVVIEIVSPDDTIDRTRDRFLDYQHLGVRHMLLMHPEACVAHRFDNGSLIQQRFESLELPTGPVPFDSQELFRQLRTELAQRREITTPAGE
jgi:Uma2 family endonuclease